MKDLNDDLQIYLNEMYIIDEFLEVRNAFELNNIRNEENLNKIKDNIINNTYLLLSNDKDKDEKLINNLKDFYSLITTTFSNIGQSYKGYNELLKNIFYKEIKKIPDINYRDLIFNYLIKEKETIVRSNESFNLLFKNVINPKKDIFLESLDKILFDDNIILTHIEEILKSRKNETNYSALNETLLYFFEKNSFIYLSRFINKKQQKKKNYLDDKNLLDFFEKCINYLIIIFTNRDKFIENKRNISKLFCFGFIKSYCFYFISLIKDGEKKIKDINQVIKLINNINEIPEKEKERKKKSENEEKVRKDFTLQLQIYIFKIIYYINDKNFELFTNTFIKKYGLDGYIYFKEMKFEDNYLYNYKYIKIKEENEKENEFIKIFEKYKQNEFNKVDYKDFDIEKYGIDLFYFYTQNLIIIALKSENFKESSKLLANFYKNVCVLLFNNIKERAISLCYNPEILKNIISEYSIQTNNINNIKVFLNSYRYFLNEISLNKKGVFSSLYNKNSYIDKNYYPGNDIRNNISIYKLFSRVLKQISRINQNDREGIFICLCTNGYNKIIDKSIFEKKKEIKCPNCKKIAWKYEFFSIKENSNFIIIKCEISEKKNKPFFLSDAEKFWEKNSLTINEFKEKYITKYYIEEKGITIKTDINHLKKDDKPVRNLTQVSYRLLNFILYSHVFFAGLSLMKKSLINIYRGT